MLSYVLVQGQSLRAHTGPFPWWYVGGGGGASAAEGGRLAGFLPRVCFLGWSVAGSQAPPSLAALFRSWYRSTRHSRASVLACLAALSRSHCGAVRRASLRGCAKYRVGVSHRQLATRKVRGGAAVRM